MSLKQKIRNSIVGVGGLALLAFNANSYLVNQSLSQKIEVLEARLDVYDRDRRNKCREPLVQTEGNFDLDAIDQKLEDCPDFFKDYEIEMIDNNGYDFGNFVYFPEFSNGERWFKRDGNQTTDLYHDGDGNLVLVYMYPSTQSMIGSSTVYENNHTEIDTRRTNFVNSMGRKINAGI